MKFTLSWLKEHLDTQASLNEICDRLTSIGLEVESVADYAEILKPFTVAQIIAAEKHPEADKLQVCKVETGNGVLDIVCGASNARPGIKIPLARIGAIIPANGMEIKKTKIRGVESNGMLCSAAELGISEEAEGILELPEAAVVGQPFAPFIGLDDALIEIAITPNRGDCLGVRGIARDLAASGIGKLKDDAEMLGFEGKFSNPIRANIIGGVGCNWFIGVYVKGVKNGPSPEWLKRRLESIGKRSISALVDITNYLTFTYGRPAHVFDADKLQGNINVRIASEGEKIVALDEKEYTLDGSMMVIADDKRPVAIAGVIGGLESGCTDATTNVYFELAHFVPEAVSRAGRILQIDSDARYRFERNVDIASHELIDEAMKLISDICGGEASEPSVAGVRGFSGREIEFHDSIIEKVTGMKPDSAKLREMLKALGFEIRGSKLGIPSWRNDVAIEEDIAEEYARLTGYDNIPVKYMQKPEKPVVALSAAQKKLGVARRLLAGRGMNEVVTFSFMDEKKAADFSAGAQLITLANPISSDLGVMRPSIVANLLDAAASNQARGKRSFSFFEAGSIFANGKNGEFVQRPCLAGLRCGVESEKTALSKEKTFNVFRAKEDMLAVIGLYMDASKLSVEKNEAFGYYHPGRSGTVRLGNKLIAVFGEIHPSIRKKFDLKSDACAFEIFTGELPEAKAKGGFARAAYSVSNFQAIERDFAFIVESKVAAQDVVAAVRKSGKSINGAEIEDIRIFDIYEGEKLGEGKKSIAFNVRIQPASATLTDEQIEAASASIVDSVRSATGGSLRDA